MEWSPQPFPDNPNAVTDTESDADSKRLQAPEKPTITDAIIFLSQRS